MSQEVKRLTQDDYLQLMQKPMEIGGMEVRFAEPTIARMDGINEVFGIDGFDVWETNPAKHPIVSRMLMVRFDGDKERVLRVCELCMQEVPKGFDPDRVTGVELGALLQGFFIYYHVRAGTITLSQKLMLPATGPTGSQGSTPRKRSRKSGKSKTKPSGC